MTTPSTPIAPVQRTGWKSGATKKVSAATRHEAILLFQKARMRLLDVNHWQDLCGPGSAEFRLTDGEGHVLLKPVAEKGNLIRIGLPAPENASGSGYDWVRIEAFEQYKELMKDEEHYGFRVRPVPNPQGRGEESAHFYDEAATSSFVIIRRANVVIALERGRNERPNAGGGGLLNGIRNVIVAVLAKLGLGKRQWQSLMRGLLKR